MEADWDLHAVVRGCAATSAAATTTTPAAAATTSLCSFNPRQQKENLDCSSTNNITTWFNEELHDLYLPFLHRPPPPEQPLPPQSPPPPAPPAIPILRGLPANSQSLSSNASSTITSNSRATGKRRYVN